MIKQGMRLAFSSLEVIQTKDRYLKANDSFKYACWSSFAPALVQDCFQFRYFLHSANRTDDPICEELDLAFLAGCTSHHTHQEIWTAEHEAVPSIAPFHHFGIRNIDNHFDNLWCKCRFIFRPYHKSWRDMTPGSISRSASINPQALGLKLRDPFVTLFSRKIVVEYSLCIFGGNCYNSFLEVLRENHS